MSKSTIGTYVIRGPIGPTGPVGPTGNTGETGNTGPTGPTGDYGRYIKNIDASKNSIILTLSDGNTFEVIGNFRGATSEFYISGTTSPSDALSLISSFNTGTQTASIRGLTFTGSLYLTEDSDYIYVHSNVSPTASQLDIANLNQNTLVYLKTNSQISSTTVGISFDDNYYQGALVYDDTAYSNGKTKLNASSKINYISPVFRTDDPIYLNADEAGTFYIATPIGIAGITGTFRKNESISVTLIIENENIWHFPENIYFEANENYLTCGKSVINITSTDQGETWLATVAARGFDVDVSSCTISNTLGSCCYTSRNFEQKCLDYTTKEICDSYFGTFNALRSCDIACGATGICCTNGRCIENSNPAECSSFGGSFYSGVTCGAFNNNPNDSNFGNRLCPNNCESEGLVSCCKDGVCLGDTFTKLLCEQVLGGKAVEGSCDDANCCDQLVGNGPCCTLGGVCIESTKVECDALSGIYMGEGFECSQINCECLDINQTSDPIGACCDGDTCSQKLQSICEFDDNIFIGGTCTDTICDTPSGACCKDCNCSVTSQSVCISQGGVYSGDNTTCLPGTCNSGEECSCTIDTFESSYDCLFDTGITCDVSVKMYNSEENELIENTSHFTSGIAFPQVRQYNGNEKTIFRQGMAVKDFYIPVESMISSSGEKTIKIDSDGTGRVCLKLNVAGISQMNANEIKSLRFYVLRTFYPRHFSHNLAALKGLSFDAEIPYQFINPAENTNENLDGNGNIPRPDGDYHYQGTKKLREQLNGPLYGQIRKNSYDQINSLITTLSLPVRPKAYESGYKAHFLDLGLNTFGATGIYNIVTLPGSGSVGVDLRIYTYNTNGSYDLVNPSPTVNISQYINNTGKFFAIPSNQNKTIFYILDNNYADSLTSSSQAEMDGSFEKLKFQFETLKYNYPYGDVSLAHSGSGYQSGVVLPKNYRLPNGSPYFPDNVYGSSAYLFLLTGYHSHGYKTFTNNVLPKDTIRSYYKTLSKLSVGFSNTFLNYSETASDQIFGKTGLIKTGHPWTVDLRDPDYKYQVDQITGSTKFLSKKYITEPSSIIFDSSTIILSKDYIISNRKKAYHKIINNYITDGMYFLNDGTLDNIGFDYDTHSNHNRYTVNTEAIADPYYVQKRTKPRGSMSISDELNPDGSINISCCITIPNIRSYMASFNDIVGDDDHNSSEYAKDDPFVNDGYRFKAFADTLRLVIFTDVISPDYTINQKDIGTTTTITLNTACEGEGCNFESSGSIQGCNFCDGDYTDSICRSYYFQRCVKYRDSCSNQGCEQDDDGIDCYPNCQGGGGNQCCNASGYPSCADYWFVHSGKITFSQNENCNFAYVKSNSRCIEVNSDTPCCAGAISNDSLCRAFVSADIVNGDYISCGDETDCETRSYAWPACGNPEPSSWAYNPPDELGQFKVYLPDDFDISQIPINCSFISDLSGIILDNCPCEGSACFAPYTENSNGFKSFTSKKIYLNATDSICVPIENSDIRSLNNFEDCDS